MLSLFDISEFFVTQQSADRAQAEKRLEDLRPLSFVIEIVVIQNTYKHDEIKYKVLPLHS